MLTKTSFAKFCRENRRRLNLSQEELAKKLGVSLSLVARWEQSRVEPRLDQIRVVERVLKASFSPAQPELPSLEAKEVVEIANLAKSAGLEVDQGIVTVYQALKDLPESTRKVLFSALQKHKFNQGPGDSGQGLQMAAG